jgi:predicted alpha-1,6-mannanase (GH76 family)
VRRSNTSEVLVPALSRLLNFVALLINNACLGLVLGLELNLALKSLDLLRVEKVTILVTVLDLLLLGNDSVLNLGLIRSRRSSRDDSLFLLLGDRGLLLGLNALGC